MMIFFIKYVKYFIFITIMISYSQSQSQRYFFIRSA